MALARYRQEFAVKISTTCDAMMLRGFPVWCFGLASCVLLCHLPAEGDTLLDYTFPGGLTLAESPGVPVTSASSFTVGVQDVEITSIDFRLAGGSSPSSAETAAYIFTDSGGMPGVLVGSSQRSFGLGELGLSFAFYDYAFASPLTLSAGGSYWAAFGIAPTGNYSYYAFTRDVRDFSGSAVAPSLSWATGSYPPSGQWTVNAPGESLVYTLEGNVVVVPEPTSLGVVLFGLCALCIRARNRVAWTQV